MMASVSIASLFPVTNPTWIFFLVLMIILFAPLLLGRLRIPHIIGMILAGVLVGEHGFNILVRDSSFELFGRVGIFYIMFLAGLEMDMEGFRKNGLRGLVFGTLTSLIPFAAGLYVGREWLGFGVAASVLLSCIFASHTLVAYPIVGKYGLNRHPVVTISVGGTLVALLLALLTLAGIAGVYKGTGGIWFWTWFAAKCVVYGAGVIYLFPRLTRWFFRHYADSVMQYIFVLSLVFLSAALAELAGLEGILGAFLAGLVLNRFIPHVSPLMNRIEFVGNALFIPYFLIGVGMLINVRGLFDGGNALKVVAVMVVVATLTKWLAALLTQKLFRMDRLSRILMFGLSEAHAAGALAMVIVGTKIEVSPGTYLMNDDVLNGVVLMILVSCIISSLATEMAARRMTLVESARETETRTKEKIMVSFSNPQTVNDLVDMSLLLRNARHDEGLLGISVVDDNEHAEPQRARARKNLDLAARIAAAADVPMQVQSRVSINAASGILHAMTENEASTLVIGLHHKTSLMDSFFGMLTQSLLKGMNKQLLIVKCVVPANTLRRIVVAVPPKAEFEAGFYKWVRGLCHIGGHLGCRIHFYAHPDTLLYIKNYVQEHHADVRTEYGQLDDWDDLLLLAGQVNFDHLFVVVSARRGSISYQSSFEKLPDQIAKYFSNNSLLVLYPDQFGDPQEMSFINPRPHAADTSRSIYDNVWRVFYKWIKRDDERD